LKNVKHKYLERIKAIIHDNNSIQFYLFTCRLNCPEANYKASASRKREKKRTEAKNVDANKIILPLKQIEANRR
jgi:hypothetical protein